MGDGGDARTSRATARLMGGQLGVGWACWAGGGVGGGGWLAAYLSIVAIFFFLKPHREYTVRAQVPLKKKNRNINILISCAWQRA